MMDIEKLELKLDALSEYSFKIAKNAWTDGDVKPDVIQISSQEVERFEYGAEGVKVGSISQSFTEQFLWVKPIIQLQEKIRSVDAFVDVVNAIIPLTNLNEWTPETLVEKFVTVNLLAFFENDNSVDSVKSKEIKDLFINDLTNENVICRVVVFLDGVTLESQTIQLEEGVVLRQTRKMDCEKQKSDFHQMPLFTYPSSVIEIEKEIRYKEMGSIVNEVQRIVGLLRLYSVGAVKFYCCEIKTDSICRIEMLGTYSPGNLSSVSRRKYYITTEMEKGLQEFIKDFTLPKHVYVQVREKVDYLCIAFDRYTETLLEGGLFEQQMNKAMTGLEALFTDDNKEVSYKIRIRVAKLLSLLGNDGIAVRKFVAEGYSIRSTFAHGGILKPKEITRLNAKYGSSQIILHSALNYLRLSIIIFAHLGLEKKNVLDLIENSLLDTKSQEELKQKLKGVAKFIA